MKIFAVSSCNYNKPTVQKQSITQLPSFKGSKGAGVGSALGLFGSVIAAGALIASGPLALIGGMVAGFAGGALAGHATEELIDKIEENKNNNKNNNNNS